MFFNKKSKKETEKCNNCKSNVHEEFSFCPYCGNVLFDPESRADDFGMLGKSDFFDDSLSKQKIADSNLTITDKMISSIMNSLMKNLEVQFKDIDKSNSPGRGIRINIGLGNAQQKNQKRQQKHDFSINKISQEQLQKLSELPKTNAKTKVKRLGDKVIYELEAPGIESMKDIFVSKLESGYEIKALTKNKVYVNSLPVNMPIHSFTLDKDKLSVEFMGNFD